MRLVSLLALFAVSLNLPSSASGPKSTTEQPDISRSGTDFLEVCSNNEATCLGWVEGFGDGLSVHDELLGIPEKDRMVCKPRGVTTIRTMQIIRKYITDNPAKAHRPTRYNASVALAGAFPCKRGK